MAVLYPLVNGIASFVIDSDVRPTSASGGSQLPTADEPVENVRQHLSPTGYPIPLRATRRPGGDGQQLQSRCPQRSRRGRTRQHHLCGRHVNTPQDLSDTLMSVGAVNTMQLNINPEWVELTRRAPWELLWQREFRGRTGQRISTSSCGRTRLLAVMAKTAVTPSRHR